MMRRGVLNILEAVIVVAVLLTSIIIGGSVFADTSTTNNKEGAFLADNELWVENNTCMPGDTIYVHVKGKWNIVMRAYEMVMYYDSSKINIVDVSLRDTIAVAIPGNWELDWWNHENETPSYIQSVVFTWDVDIPPGLGNLWNITVQIANDTPEGDTLLDLFNNFTDPVKQCAFYDIYLVKVNPELHDGVLTIISGICGDCNFDGVIDLGDVVYLTNYLFRGGDAPLQEPCFGDANGNTIVDVGDIIYLINYLFKGGSAPGGCCD